MHGTLLLEALAASHRHISNLFIVAAGPDTHPFGKLLFQGSLSLALVKMHWESGESGSSRIPTSWKRVQFPSAQKLNVERGRRKDTFGRHAQEIRRFGIVGTSSGMLLLASSDSRHFASHWKRDVRSNVSRACWVGWNVHAGLWICSLLFSRGQIS